MPMLTENVNESAERAEAALRQVVSWASWRLGWIMGLIVAALVLFSWLSSTAMVWWDAGTISNLRDEITQMQANRDIVAKAGMLGSVSYCGSSSRPCVRADESAGAFGTNSNYRIISGYQNAWILMIDIRR